MRFYNQLKKLNESTILLEYNRKDLRTFAGDEYAAKFFNLRDKLQAPENDLGHWIKKGDVDAFKKFIDDWESGVTKSKTQQKKDERISGAELVYDDKGWKMYFVTSYDAAKQLGSGTTWCITGRYHGYESRGKEFFNNYIRDYKLDGGYYFLFDTLNKDPQTGDYLKYCIGPKKGGGMAFMYNGMQDEEISRKGITNIPEDRRIQPLLSKGIEIRYFDAFVIKDGVLVEFKKEALRSSAEVIIPEGVEVIAKGVFESSLAHFVKFPSTLKEIKTGAFSSSSLVSCELPPSVEKLGSGVFLNCKNLKSIDMSKTQVKEIPNFFCYACESLEDLKLPAGINSIGKQPFVYCNNIYLVIAVPDNNKLVIDYARQENIDCIDSETGKLFSEVK